MSSRENEWKIRKKNPMLQTAKITSLKSLWSSPAVKERDSARRNRRVKKKETARATAVVCLV